ncbi:MAG TPA: glycosyltransferase family 39 protein [Candidatus Sulfotelmatobacter sp.]|nr:glycosyltransferase family 39 protein [Candidatus Sulfotelmatobacter sp.]
MREQVRKHARFFLGASLAALGLRLFFVFRFPAVVDDSRLYANVAENWLHYGVYGVTDSGQVVPTLSRLPGYPAFLAAIFTVFGIGNFRAVLLIQVLIDLATCFLIADITRRLVSARAARAAFLLAAACPFLANYAAAALTECLETFFTVLALDLALSAVRENVRDPDPRPGFPPSRHWIWLACGLACGGAILLRPDGGILLAAIGGYLLSLMLKSWAPTLITDATPGPATSQGAIRKPEAGSQKPLFLPILRTGLLLALGAVIPLIPWTVRNLHTFHRFQPLAPRYANDSDEPVMLGFNRWVKTWMADYVSVEEIYWNVPGDPIDLSRLPRRTFDSEQQRQETAALVADYNHDRDITPELDARFAALAASRIKAKPFRYYVWLPAARIADMWLRPRTELLPPDPRWWEFNDEWRPAAAALGLGVLNLIYLGMASAGWFRAREYFGIGLLVLFLLIRSAFLGTLENPETRYTLECYPVVIILAASVFR